ncbi:MAG: hypothetical protein DMF88_18185 [Acidobacteria bacterium]|nr:MAG: hypothetical protein DMF88_18185 [Acidobacteriota bacterium]
MVRHVAFLICLLAITTSLVAHLATRETRPSVSERASPPAAMKDRVREQYGRLPLSFERNEGQTDPSVEFLSRGSGYTMFLTRGAGTVVVLSGAVLRLTPVGGNTAARAKGHDELPGKVNYLRTSDRKQWRTGIATFAKVAYDNIYSGIDLVYYGNQQQLEYDFVVHAGADPRTITLDVEGADTLAIDAQGDLMVSVGGRSVRQRKPVVYQENGGGRTEIDGRYTIAANHRVSFQPAAYDRSQPVVIDPILVYSTFLGGTTAGELAVDSGGGIAVDFTGSAYLTGHTESADFPTTAGAFDTTWNRFGDAFVTKLDATGASLVYSTYLGGSAGFDLGTAIAVDSTGHTYVTGFTESWDFPTTSGAFDRIFTGTPGVQGGQNAFVTKLDATGAALAYSTFLGGAGMTAGMGIAVDASGSAYVTGSVQYFPLVGAAFPATPGAFDTTFNNTRSYSVESRDAFVTKFDAAGAALMYSTFLGGNGDDVALGIAVDPNGDAYVTGQTSSDNFPTTARAFDTSANGDYDGFVTKLDAAGATLRYSTYLGGRMADSGSGIAIDMSGNAYVTGSTSSSDFPITARGFDTTWNGLSDAFVIKLNAAGTALRYSTYVGGDGDDAGTGIALDESGRAYLTGFTSSANFPTTPGAFDASVNGSRDVFITKLDAAGAALVYSTYLGGGCDDNGQAVAVDAGGSAYVTGTTCSKDFPTTIGAFDTSVRGQNAFVTKMNIAGTAPVYSTYLGGDFLSGLHGDTGGQIAVDADGSAYVTGTTISIDFPTTIGALKTNRTAFLDAFVTKLDATGSALVYSTYLGGSDQDYGNGIAVDAVGSAYVTGNTSSADFPTTLGAFAPYFYRPGAFVTKLDPAGAALVYSTYLGSDADAEDIAVDGGGNAYVTGSAGDYFPTTIGAFDPLSNGYRDAFVTKLDAAGAALVYSTYLGGSDFDSASGIAIDANGSAYVTGSTRSLDFPITVGAFDTAASTSGDAFVTKLDPAGAVLLYSTFLGGRESEGGTSIAVDASGRAYVTGITHSDDFPTTAGAFDTTANGGDDVFLTKLDAAGAAVVYSTYLGGIRDDHALAIEIDASGSAYVTGRTFSWNFPTTAGAVDRIWSGGADVFVTKVDATGGPLTQAVTSM